MIIMQLQGLVSRRNVFRKNINNIKFHPYYMFTSDKDIVHIEVGQIAGNMFVNIVRHMKATFIAFWKRFEAESTYRNAQNG